MVGLEEVRRDAARWRVAFENSLVSGPVRVITRSQLEAMKREGKDMEQLPTKAVATEKPNKDKGRIVVCGHCSDAIPESEADGATHHRRVELMWIAGRTR